MKIYGIEVDITKDLYYKAGNEEGRDEGREEGIELGIERGKLQVCQTAIVNMGRKRMSREKIRAF